MHLVLARSAMILIVATSVASAESGPKGYPYAYFEAPRSLGTPLSDLARIYTGPGLADRIAGRLRLDTDNSLTSATRELIRQHLAQDS
jgi:hypothetical protein